MNRSDKSMTSPPLFSIIIVSLNGGGVIARALDSIRKTDYPAYEVIVVSNGSTDNLAEVVRTQYPEVRLIESPINLGFAGGNNLGLREAQGDIFVLLNDDTEVRPQWLEGWARAAAENPGWGLMGCKLLYPDGVTIQHAGGIMNPNGSTNHIGYEQRDDGRFDELLRCPYVTGAAIAIRREVYDLLGPLDEKYFPIYFEETDYCWQTRRIGYEVLYVPDCVVIHHESRTQVRYSFKFIYRYNRGRMRFLAKCFSGGQLLHAARYELRWWFRRYSYQSYIPTVYAYFSAFVRLPALLRDRFPFQRRMAAIARRMAGNR